MKKEFEVVVIGAGPAGSTAARCLSNADVTVALIERSAQPKMKIGESLPSSARPLLKKLNLDSYIKKQKHLQNNGNDIIWGGQGLKSKDFLFDPSEFGWHLDRELFDSSLLKLSQDAGAQLLRTEILDIQKEQTAWKIKTAAGEINCAFIIDASGAFSVMGSFQSGSRTCDDSLLSLFKWIEDRPSARRDIDSRTYIEATSNGWWYSSKIPGKKRIIAFHTDSDLVNTADRNQFWLDQMKESKYLSDFYSENLKSTKLNLRQASGSCAKEYCGPGWLAVGDAAMSFDPISSQGIFNALYTGDLGGRTVIDLLQGRGESLLNFSQRLDLIRESYLQNQKMIYAAENRWPTSPFWNRRHETSKYVVNSSSKDITTKETTDSAQTF